VVNVEFTEPVTNVLVAQFIVSNGQVTGLSGSGQNYAVTITPQVKGMVNLQYAANQVTGATGQGNYPSNPLAVSFDPLNQFLSTWLPFEEGAGVTTADGSGHGNNGALNNMPPGAWITGNIGNALAFDGVDDFVRINNHLGATFTISCWIKSTQSFQQVTPTYDGTGIIWSDVGGGANDFVLGGTRSAGGVDRLSFFVGSGNLTTSGTQEITSGQWTHLAVTRNGTNGEVKLYVNGTLDASSAAGIAPLTANPNIHIGGNTLDGRYFNGSIDDVRFYSRVLTQTEIATLLTTTPPTVMLATASASVTNAFPVTVSFSEVVLGFTAEDLVVINGTVGPLNGSGGVYSFTVTPSFPGPVTVRIPGAAAVDADGNANLGSADLVVNAIDGSIPATGLAGHWSFNETNGTTAFDSSGTGNHGAMINLNNANRVTGVWGNGLAFNGTNTYVTVSNTLGADFSLSVWIKGTQVFQQTDQTFNGTGIIWSDVGGNANDFILGGTRNLAGTNRLSFFTGNPDSSLNGTRNISDGKWTHLAVVRKKATGERRVFVNGSLDAANTAGTNLLTANAVINFGGNTLNSRFFAGYMDEVRAYNRALSDAEVLSLANAGGYASWVTQTMPGTPAAQTIAAADPDNDGQLNLLEYALGTDPLAVNLSAFNIERTGDGSLWLTYPRRTGFSGLRYTVLQSDDLLSWSAVGSGFLEESTQTVPGDALEIVSGRIVEVAGRAFFRLEVDALTP
jgi:hypothetical protein